MQAAQISLDHGKARYTQQLLDAYIAVGDKDGFKRDFGKILASSAGANSYPALTNYGMGLAHFADPGASDAFEQAIAFSSQNRVWAVNEYARYLIDNNQASKAAIMLESNTDVVARARFILPAFLRQEARKKAGLDTSDADHEVAVIVDVLENSPGFGRKQPPTATASYRFSISLRLRGFMTQLKAFASQAARVAIAALGGMNPQAMPAFAASPTPTPGGRFSHTNASDDCRNGATALTNVTFSDNFNWNFSPHVVNMAEVEYNERGPENNLPWGAVDAVGWTIRDRAYENVCGAPNDNNCGSPSTGYSFEGGCYYRSHPNHDPAGLSCSALPFSDCESQDQNGNCVGIDPNSKWYCCAEHGGAVAFGESQSQINDGHVDPTLLLNNGYLASAVYVMLALVPDMSKPNGDGTYYHDPRISNCIYSCITPICSVPSRIQNGGDVINQVTTGYTDKASPFGPVEFMTYPWFSPTRPWCEHQPYDSSWGAGNVCTGGNGFASNQIPFFSGQTTSDNTWYNLTFSDGAPFGSYNYTSWPWLWHTNMGFESPGIPQNDPSNGIWLWDWYEQTWFYTNPTDFPWLFHWTLQHWWYYYPGIPGPYTSNPRWFHDQTTGQDISDPMPGTQTRPPGTQPPPHP